MKSQVGFTLLEIMVVLVIVAIMSSVVVMNIGSASHGSFKSDLTKIATTLDILADEAVYTNSVILCKLEDNELSCVKYKNGDYQDLDIRKLVSWGWPDNLKITQILVNDVPLKEDQMLRFTPNGNLPLISFRITNGVQSAWVDGNMDGDFVVNQ